MGAGETDQERGYRSGRCKEGMVGWFQLGEMVGGGLAGHKAPKR
jgi:hypothetical protein